MVSKEQKMVSREQKMVTVPASALKRLLDAYDVWFTSKPTTIQQVLTFDTESVLLDVDDAFEKVKQDIELIRMLLERIELKEIGV